MSNNIFDSKYSNLLTIFLIVGIVIIIGAIGVTGFIISRNGNEKQESTKTAENLQEEVTNKNSDNEVNVDTNTGLIEVEENVLIDSNTINSTNSNNTTSMKLYKGFPMVGTIEIPAINLEYPVLESASKSAIDVSVAIYDGPGLNEVGNTTIVGHNYRDGRFFSNNKKLVEGDKVYITDLRGNKVEYVIYRTYTTTPEDSTYLDRDTEGKREISLITCTDDTQSRLIIWAREQ